MRIIVCGGRDFSDKEFLFSKLDTLTQHKDITEVIHGDAYGADSLAGEWARTRGIIETPFPADWKKHGKAAGPIRNAEMLKLGPDMVIAFDGGVGTAHMVKITEKAGIPVIKLSKKTEELFN